jgi:diadenosine tetraphosphate (Ap4A) HIT family hydrolase
MTASAPCPFCARIAAAPSLQADGTALALPDAFPLNPGHTLVIPRRHVADLFTLTTAEQADIWGLVAKVRERILQEHHPDAFNIGVNVGAAAGQTVDHAHVHVIPRHRGDVPDPRGGVRWVVPSRAPYWKDLP